MMKRIITYALFVCVILAIVSVTVSAFTPTCGHPVSEYKYLSVVGSHYGADPGRCPGMAAIRKYQCQVCGSIAQEIEDYRERHLFAEDENGIWKCIYCGYLR